MSVNTIQNASQLRDEFISMDRDYYSYEGYEAIFKYFEDFEEAMELDVVAICCDFNEETENNIRDNYDIPYREDVMEYLEHRTIAQRLNNGNIFYQYF